MTSASQTNTTKTFAPPHGLNPEALARWLWSLVQIFRPADGWATVFLLALNLMVVVWSVERGNWVPTPNLVGLVLLAMLTGLILARIPIWSILVLPWGLVIGLWVVVAQLTAYQAEGMELSSSAELFQRLNLWFEAAKDGSINVDREPFAFALMVATWLSGYLAAWVFFRHRNFWGVFILGGTGLLSNLTYLPASGSIFLGVYLLTALLLISRVRAVRLRREWRENNFQYDNHLGWLALSDSLLLSIVVLIVAFAFLPVGRHWQPTHDVYEYMRSPLERFEGDFNRLFAGLPARRPLPYRIWGDVIAFQGTINPTTTPVLQVNSPLGMYWKARSYGTYTPKGWVSEDTVLKPTDWTPAVAAPQPYEKRFEITYAVTPSYSSKNLFAGGQVLSTDQDVRIETYDSPQYTLNLTGLTPRGLPPKLAVASLGLEQTLRQEGATASDSSLARSLPLGFELAEVSRQNGNVESVTLTEILPEQPDTLSVRNTNRKIKAGETYVITSSVSLAEPDDLQTAGLDYPTWALVKYTQLSDTLPQRIRDLGDQITAGAETPYDKAIAIEDYLKANFPYNLTITPPPYGADGVDHFLFTNKTGYSEYFASAMTVLLRTQGVPARLATGYTVGDKLEDHEVYIVTDSHSHAWVEVFFPRFGWIPFEPTPGNMLPVAYVPAPEFSEPVLDFPEEDLDALLCDDDDLDNCDDDGGEFNLGSGAEPAQVTLFDRLARSLPWVLSGLGVAAIIGGLGWLFWRRYLTPSTDPLLTFRRLAFLGALNSAGPADHQTPYQYQERLREELPSQEGNLSVIIEAYVRSLYGQKELSEAEGQRLTQAWLGIRMPLLLHIFRRRTSTE